MDHVVVGIETGQQQKFKASLDVVLSQLELCLDFVDLFVLQRSILKRVAVQTNLWVVKTKLANAPEKPRLQDHFHIQAILHALEVFCRVFHCHRLAFLVLDVMLVNDV